MKWTIDKKIGAGFIFVCALIGILGILLVRSCLHSKVATGQVVAIAAVFIVTILLISLLWLALNRIIVKPIAVFVNLTGEMVAKGEFAQIAKVSKGDEIGMLVDNFNTVIGKVNSLLSESEEASMSLALGLSEQYDVLVKMAKGDFSVSAPERNDNELIAKQGALINKVLLKLQATNAELEESVMDMALGLSETFEVFKKVAAGDLTARMAVASSNELFIKLGEVINNTNESLNNLIGGIHRVSQQIASSANEILAASNQLMRTTETQAGSLTEITSTANEVAATANELSRNAQNVSNLAQASAKTSQAGSGIIVETLEGMTRIKDSNKTTSARLSLLSEKAENIDKVVNTIINVADQTNLLSLNAAIEAAKAGEQGKGFAVVAQEIRKLADQTSIASQDIGNMIGEIKAAVNSSVMSMEKSSEDVRAGTDLVNNAGGIFRGIIENHQNILPQIETIASAVNQQAESVKQVSVAINQIQEGLNLTVASAKQSQVSADELNSTAKELKGAVVKFKLK